MKNTNISHLCDKTGWCDCLCDSVWLRVTPCVTVRVTVWLPVQLSATECLTDHAWLCFLINIPKFHVCIISLNHSMHLSAPGILDSVLNLVHFTNCDKCIWQNNYVIWPVYCFPVRRVWGEKWLSLLYFKLIEIMLNK